MRRRPLRYYVHRLFFTKDGQVDLGWMLLLIGFLNAMVMIDLQAFGVVHLPWFIWAFYGSLFVLLFIAGTTVSKARLLANSPAVANVASNFRMPNVTTSTDVQELKEFVD